MIVQLVAGGSSIFLILGENILIQRTLFRDGVLGLLIIINIDFPCARRSDALFDSVQRCHDRIIFFSIQKLAIARVLEELREIGMLGKVNIQIYIVDGFFQLDQQLEPIAQQGRSCVKSGLLGF